MRLIKMFGLAAIAVGAFMAFLGATSASAITSLEKVVLCKVLQDPCLAANVVPSGTGLHTSSTDPILLGPSFNVLCASSQGSGSTTTALAHGELTSLTWTTCKRTDNGSACTVTSEHLPFLIQGELKSDHVGYEVLVKETNKGRPQAKVSCSGLTCAYGASHVIFEALDVSGVTVLDVLQNLTGEGFCGLLGEGVWHAKYTTTCLLPAGTAVNCYLAMEENVVLSVP